MSRRRRWKGRAPGGPQPGSARGEAGAPPPRSPPRTGFPGAPSRWLSPQDARRPGGAVWYWGLFALVVCLVVAGVLVFRPFWDILFVAAVLTTLLYPVYRRVLGVLGAKRRGLASVATCGIFVFLVLVPVSWLGFRIAVEATSALRSGAKRASSAIDTAAQIEAVQAYLREHPAVEDRVRWLKASLEKFAAGLESAASPPAAPESEDEEPSSEPPAVFSPSSESIAWLATNLGGAITRFLTGAIGLGIKLFLMLFLMYYFFKDGPEILDSLRKQVPLDRESQERVIETFRSVSRAILRGTFLTSLAQGLVATVAYACLGLPAIFWGALTALAALLPAVGTGIVTVPITLTFALGGEWTKAAVMGAVAIFISTLDNVLRPLLVESSLRLHPVWILLSILGGISVFGVLGFVIGPMVVVLLRTLLQHFVYEAQPRSAEPAGSGPQASAPGGGGSDPPRKR